MRSSPVCSFQSTILSPQTGRRLTSLTHRSVKLTTSAPQITLEGTLFTACPSSNLIAIAVAPTSQSTTKPAAHDVPFPSPSSSSAPASDYHILPVSRLTSFSLLSLADTNISTSPSLFDSPVDLRALRTREAAAVKTARERVARRGVGVSVEAQDIFDALARTYVAHRPISLFFSLSFCVPVRAIR